MFRFCVRHFLVLVVLSSSHLSKADEHDHTVSRQQQVGVTFTIQIKLQRKPFIMIPLLLIQNQIIIIVLIFKKSIWYLGQFDLIKQMVNMFCDRIKRLPM